MVEDMDHPAVAAAEDLLAGMLDRLGVDAEVTSYGVEEASVLRIETEDAAGLIGRGGQSLEALQFLVNRALRHRYEDSPRIVVDIEGYRERHREQLVQKAREIADRVRRWGDPVTLEPMNAFDRRVVHMALRDDKDVETSSPPEADERHRKPITIRIREEPA